MLFVLGCFALVHFRSLCLIPRTNKGDSFEGFGDDDDDDRDYSSHRSGARVVVAASSSGGEASSASPSGLVDEGGGGESSPRHRPEGASNDGDPTEPGTGGGLRPGAMEGRGLIACGGGQGEKKKDKVSVPEFYKKKNRCSHDFKESAVFFHVGKAGGGTISRELKSNYRIEVSLDHPYPRTSTGRRAQGWDEGCGGGPPREVQELALERGGGKDAQGDLRGRS